MRSFYFLKATFLLLVVSAKIAQKINPYSLDVNLYKNKTSGFRC